MRCCEHRKCLVSIMDDSVITCDEILEAEAKSGNKGTKAIPTNFNEKKLKKITCKIQNLYLLLAFLLIIILLLVAISVYHYVIKW